MTEAEERMRLVALEIGRAQGGDYRDSIADQVLAVHLIEKYPDRDYAWFSARGWPSCELRDLLGFWAHYEQKYPEWFEGRVKGMPFEFWRVVFVARKVYRKRNRI